MINHDKKTHSIPNDFSRLENNPPQPGIPQLGARPFPSTTTSAPQSPRTTSLQSQKASIPDPKRIQRENRTSSTERQNKRRGTGNHPSGRERAIFLRFPARRVFESADTCAAETINLPDRSSLRRGAIRALAQFPCLLRGRGWKIRIPYRKLSMAFMHCAFLRPGATASPSISCASASALPLLC